MCVTFIPPLDQQVPILVITTICRALVKLYDPCLPPSGSPSEPKELKWWEEGQSERKIGEREKRWQGRESQIKFVKRGMLKEEGREREKDEREIKRGTFGGKGKRKKGEKSDENLEEQGLEKEK